MSLTCPLVFPVISPNFILLEAEEIEKKRIPFNERGGLLPERMPPMRLHSVNVILFLGPQPHQAAHPHIKSTVV